MALRSQRKTENAIEAENRSQMDKSIYEGSQSSSVSLSRSSLRYEIGINNRNEIIPLQHQKSNVSEILRIISGVREDIGEEASEAEAYRSRSVPESFIVEELERVSRMNTELGDESVEEFSPEKEEDRTIPPPDKGYAWWVAFVSMMAVFATWGSNASFGVFLQYYLDNDVFPGASKLDFALIGGIVVSLGQGLSPITIIVYRIIGLRATVILGIIIQTAGYILASFATKIWHLYLCQGVMVGSSFSLVYLPSSLILPTWFEKHKALAMGIAVSGAGLGGLVFSLSVHRVFEMTGNQHWGLRLAALIALIAALPCLFIKPRYGEELPFKQRALKKFIKDNLRLVFDFSVFKTGAFVVLIAWFMMILLGYVVMLFSLSSYSTLIGLTSSQATILTSLMNVGQTIGRPLFGVIGDSVGRSNASAVTTLGISIWLLAFWINAKSFGAMVPFSLILGLTIGVGSTMVQPLATDIFVDHSKLPATWSALNVFVSMPSLVAETIALALKRDDSENPFLHTQIFTGVVYFGCFSLMLFVRQYLVAKTLRNRIKAAQTKLEQWTTPGSRYLTTDKHISDEDRQEIERLNNRIERHEMLLQNSFKFYLIRTFYPIKV